MIDTSITLISKVYSIDTVGNQIETETEIECPIKRIESIYSSEFYRASQQGFKPSKRFVISSLNYNNENELIYKNQYYQIIRSEEINMEEVVLICEVKIHEIS